MTLTHHTCFSHLPHSATSQRELGRRGHAVDMDIRAQKVGVGDHLSSKGSSHPGPPHPPPMSFLSLPQLIHPLSNQEAPPPTPPTSVQLADFSQTLWVL